MGCNCGQAVKREPVKQVTKRKVVTPATKTATRRVIKRPLR